MKVGRGKSAKRDKAMGDKALIGRKKILLVDDEKNLVVILKAVLEAGETEVRTAGSLPEALRALEEEFFDVIIADICLTDVRSREGLELIRHARSRNGKTHIVGMAGCGTEEVERQCYEHGADFYFNKPLDLKILIRHLSRQGVVIEALS